jgi:hypothetical protein
MSREERLGWIEPEHAEMPITRQCELAVESRLIVDAFNE